MAFNIILFVQMTVSTFILTFFIVSLLAQTSNSALLDLNVDLSASTIISTSNEVEAKLAADV